MNSSKQDGGVGGLSEAIKFDLDDGVAMEFILIHPGVFIMGSDKLGAYGCAPAHKVSITKPFYIGKFVVTQEQWEKVMGERPRAFKGAKYPMEGESWNNCQIFIAKLNGKFCGTDFRLPTEAQWEYACRAGTTTEFSFGDSADSGGDYAWFASHLSDLIETHEVGGKKPNPWGLYDMHGNVRQWCSDGVYSICRYAPFEQVDPQGDSSGFYRVVRGGSSKLEWGSADRSPAAPTLSYARIGLRLVVIPC